MRQVGAETWKQPAKPVPTGTSTCVSRHGDCRSKQPARTATCICHSHYSSAPAGKGKERVRVIRKECGKESKERLRVMRTECGTRDVLDRLTLASCQSAVTLRLAVFLVFFNAFLFKKQEPGSLWIEATVAVAQRSHFQLPGFQNKQRGQKKD